MPPKDEVWDILDSLKLEEGDIVFITSKIMAIHQGRCVPSDGVKKKDLFPGEASHLLSYVNYRGTTINLTLIDNNLMASAGIDASNANGHYILWPKDIDKLCREMREYLLKKNNIKKLGVISTDTRSQVLRQGVTGFAIGLSGIKPLKDLRGEKDIFGRELKVTRVNRVDALSSMAVLIMGEAAEQTPVLILRGYENIEFCGSATINDIKSSPENDTFKPLLDCFEGKEI